MEPYFISNIEVNDNNQKVLRINPLYKHSCTFDCVFCPFGRTKVKTESAFEQKKMDKFLSNLEEKLKKSSIDILFIDPKGEALLNDRIMEIIQLGKKYDLKLKILGNGYIFNYKEYKDILNHFDEVIGELAVLNEKDFQSIIRPLEGYTLKKHIENMKKFNNQFKNTFSLDITILKGYSDSDKDILKFKEYIDYINPDKVYIDIPSKYKEQFGVSQKRLDYIRERI